jgi:UDP-glucuronate decarboxylase
LLGEPLTVYGDGAQTRSFCYVDDLIDGILRMAEAPPDVIGPVNLGNPDEFTIRELAELVRELGGSSSRIVSARELPQDDPARRRPDITLARTKLGWEPRVPLREGLARTIDWFRSVDLSRFRAPTPNY